MNDDLHDVSCVARNFSIFLLDDVFVCSRSDDVSCCSSLDGMDVLCHGSFCFLQQFGNFVPKKGRTSSLFGDDAFLKIHKGK